MRKSRIICFKNNDLESSFNEEYKSTSGEK